MGLFGAVSVAVRPFVFNVHMFIAGLLLDPLLVPLMLVTEAMRLLPPMIPQLLAAAVLSGVVALAVRVMLSRFEWWTRLMVASVVCGVALAAVNTDSYYRSVGGTESLADVAGLWSMYAALSAGWMSVGYLVAEPPARSGGQPLPAPFAESSRSSG